jgi:hypothetical protein
MESRKWRYTSLQGRIMFLESHVFLMIIPIALHPLKDHWTWGAMWVAMILMGAISGISHYYRMSSLGLVRRTFLKFAKAFAPVYRINGKSFTRYLEQKAITEDKL